MAENICKQTLGGMREVVLSFWPLWLGFAFMWPVRYVPRTSVFFELYQQFGVYQASRIGRSAFHLLSPRLERWYVFGNAGLLPALRLL